LFSGQEVSMAEPQQIKTENQARQGVTGHGVRYVLGISVALVIVGFIVAYMIVRP
jgi:amino acid permease